MLKQLTTYAFAVTCSASVYAGCTFGFANITNNNAGDAAIGEAQFCVELIDKGDSTVEFYFTNSGPDASSMVQLYWEDNANVLSSLDSWSTTTPPTGTDPFGVDFGGGDAKPGHLPGVSPPTDFDDYSIQANTPGKSQNGVGAGENVSIFFSFLGDFAALCEAMESGDLQVGIHAQAYDSGGSESFVSVPKGDPPPGVPSPTAAIAGLALIGLTVSRRRRK